VKICLYKLFNLCLRRIGLNKKLILIQYEEYGTLGESHTRHKLMAHLKFNPTRIKAYDHIGIRVTDRDASIAFYELLGFRQTDYFRDHQANEMESADGVRINLIFNGAKRPKNHNVLLDEEVKLPGITHPAFVVDNLIELQLWLQESKIKITQGPEAIGPRRIALFIRDPDGNVLEFDQLL
jgi:lactoylglutathione lyase